MNCRSQRSRDSIFISIAVVGFISTVFSILGFSLADWKCLNIPMRIGAVLAAFIVIYSAAYIIIGKIFRYSRVKIVLYGDAEDIPLYEYRNMFRMIGGK